MIPGIQPTRTVKKSALYWKASSRKNHRLSCKKIRRQAESETTSRLSGVQPDDRRNSSDQGALSRRYPVVLSRRSRGSELAFSTEAESADKASGSKKIPPSGGIKTTSRLSGVQPDDRRNSSGRGALSRRYPVVLSRRSRGSELAFSTEAESADKASGSKRERSVTS